MRCIIVFKADKSISVIHPAPKARKLGESEDDFLNRVYLKAVVGTPLEGLDYVIKNKSDLPDRKDRDKWRRKTSTSKDIKVDTTVITKNDKIKALQDENNLVLEKASPTIQELKTVILNQEKMRTGNV